MAAQDVRVAVRQTEWLLPSSDTHMFCAGENKGVARPPSPIDKTRATNWCCSEVDVFARPTRWPKIHLPGGVVECCCCCQSADSRVASSGAAAVSTIVRRWGSKTRPPSSKTVFFETSVLRNR